MPKAVPPLTPAALRNIKPPAEGREDYLDGETPGLCLRVYASGAWRWTYRMRAPDGTQPRMPLGDFTDKQGLAWARREAEKLRQQVRHQGRNPLAERKAAAAAVKVKAEQDRLTLDVLIDDWRVRHLEANRKPRYAAEAVRALKHAFADHLSRPALALDRSAVRKTLDALQRPAKAPARARGIAGNRSAIAGRTAAYGRACFAWAMKRDAVPSNPFLNLPIEATAASRDRVLTDDELAAVWRAAEATDGPYSGIVRTLMLTGQRLTEVAGMAWAELSADRRTWTIPAARAKNGKPHLVPLSDAARTVVIAAEAAQVEAAATLPEEDRPEPPTLVFPGRLGTPFGGWSKAKAELDTDSGIDGWRIHDLRRTLATGLQRLGVKLEVTEAVLNHVSGTRAGIVSVYQRHTWADEKRAALDAWARHVLAAVEQKPAADNVVALRRA